MDEALPHRGQDGEGGLRLFRRARYVVLLLLWSIMLVALMAVPLTGHVPSLSYTAKSATMLVIAAIIAFAQYRSPLIAFAVVLGPLPAAALAFCEIARRPAPDSFGIFVALVYIAGFVAAFVGANGFVLGIASGKSPDEAGKSALRASVRTAAALLVAVVLVPAIAAFSYARRFEAEMLIWSNAAAILSAMVAIPFFCSLGGAGEDFIARINRANEAWRNRMEGLGELTKGPWRWSVTGIFWLFIILAFFGSALRTLPHAMMSSITWGEGSVLLCAMASSLVLFRDWRTAAATAIVNAGTLLIAIWGFARGGAGASGVNLLIGGDLAVIGLVPFSAIAAKLARSPGGEIAPSLAGALSENGSVAAMAALAIFALLVPWYGDAGSARFGLGLLIAFAASSVLFFQPALVAVTEALLPRRRPATEKYRVR